MKIRSFAIVVALMLGAVLIFIPCQAFAQSSAPTISVNIGESSEPVKIATSIKIMLLLTVLSIAPSIFISLTSFIRIIVVFHFLRLAMGTQTMPPNQVLAGIAMFMTFFIMAPVFSVIYNDSFVPLTQEKISAQEAYNKAIVPLRKFMVAQTREKDLALFVEMSKIDKPETIDDVPTFAIIPAFLISEMRTAFTIGFLIYVPFLVLDMVVASVLMSMGMMMLPPIMISLPFKLMLFVLVDGWYLVVGSMMKSFVM
ncbi:Flagellar biosynthesis protein FliP [hydrothermal vent metagenome]|uniref:Flagellar biosynthetic protein FliP n=1 Tax=hydrothermal vent metagenome TaxID=652676 RepID=A0A3B1C1U8_9ZZZZ